MENGVKVRVRVKNCDLLGRAIHDHREICVIEKTGVVSSEVRSLSGWEYLLRNADLEVVDGD